MGRHPSYGISKAYSDNYKSKSKTPINKLSIVLCVVAFILTSLFVFAVYYAR